MNKVILTHARLVRDIEMRQTQGGMGYVQFTVAVNRMKRKGEDKPQADFINCVAWNKTAEFLAKYFYKGSGLNLEGHIATRTYDKNGQRQYITEVVVDSVEFDGNKVERQNTAPSQADAFNSFGAVDDGNDSPFF